MHIKVRQAVVHRALHWLKQNNRYYRHIDIDYDRLMNQLPEDENLSGLSEMEAKVEQHEKKKIIQMVSNCHWMI